MIIGSLVLLHEMAFYYIIYLLTPYHDWVILWNFLFKDPPQKYFLFLFLQLFFTFWYFQTPEMNRVAGWRLEWPPVQSKVESNYKVSEYAKTRDQNTPF